MSSVLVFFLSVIVKTKSIITTNMNASALREVEIQERK